jgi:hypothetical protein
MELHIISVAIPGIGESTTFGIRLETRKSIRSQSSKSPINPNIMVSTSPVKQCKHVYSVDSISKPHASRRGSGMYFEFLL